MRPAPQLSSHHITPGEEWSEPNSLPILANNVEGDYWRNTVGKTIVTPTDNLFTDAELAGAILWGMTFYGFTRHAGWSPHEERFTSFGDPSHNVINPVFTVYFPWALRYCSGVIP